MECQRGTIVKLVRQNAYSACDIRYKYMKSIKLVIYYRENAMQLRPSLLTVPPISG